MWIALLHYEDDTVSLSFHLSETHWFPYQSIYIFVVMQEYFLKYLLSELAKYGKKKGFFANFRKILSGHIIKFNAT